MNKANIEYVVNSINEFEKQHGREATIDAIFQGAFNDHLGADITLDIIHPNEDVIKIMPEWQRRAFNAIVE